MSEYDGADSAYHTDLFYTSTTDEYGELLSEYDGADDTYHTYDALGSTDALLNDAEAATDRYTYRAFGTLEFQSGTSDSHFTFVGQQDYYKDEELDLYFAGARHLDPATGQWTSKDPIGIDAEDPNYYRYVGNNPTNQVDPSGTGEEYVIVFANESQLTLTLPEQLEGLRLQTRSRGGIAAVHQRGRPIPIPQWLDPYHQTEKEKQEQEQMFQDRAAKKRREDEQRLREVAAGIIRNRKRLAQLNVEEALAAGKSIPRKARFLQIPTGDGSNFQVRDWNPANSEKVLPNILHGNRGTKLFTRSDIPGQLQ